MIHGFVVIDKPAGITSHDVVSRIRRILGTRKVGHTGTLDPFATGVLPIAVNDGTKAIPFLDEGSKAYEALLKLGVTTDTLDMTGTILTETDPSDVTREQFSSCLAQFTGSIVQIPPMYSAIKQNGQPLYKLARQGVEVERAARDVEIYSLELLSFDLPYAAVRVVCSRGTYVRSLADDIGRQLGCGAALKKLRRTASGPFEIGAAHTLEEIEYAVGEKNLAESFHITPMDSLVHLAELKLTDAGKVHVSFGRSPRWEDVEHDNGVITEGGRLVRLSYRGDLVAVAYLMETATAVPTIVLKRVFM